MPLIKLHTSVPISEGKREAVLSSLSSLIAEKIGKPIQYVMVVLEEGPIMMSGETGSAAFADVRSIGGLSSEVNTAITVSVCNLLKEYLGIPTQRTYVTFTDVSANNWAWDGRTFG